MGNARVTTHAQFVDKTMEAAPYLKELLRVNGSSLRQKLMRFRVAFHARKHPGKMTMLICMVRAVQKYCPDHALKLLAVLKVSLSLVNAERKQFVFEVKK